ncbi:MAG: carboxypeptidase regulatory-like domain-containing protein [Planctomycetota bacterium]
MIRIITLGLEQRLFDVAAAVTVVLLVAVLLTRLIWQPAQRLAVIQWSFVGGLILAVSLMCPWQVHSLRLLDISRNTKAEMPPSLSLPDHVPLATKSELNDAKLVQRGTAEKAASSPSILKRAQKTDDTASVEKAGSQPSRAMQSTVADRPAQWLRWTAIIYVAGAFGMTLWLAIGQWTVYRLVRRAVPASPELARFWSELLSDALTINRTQHGLRARLLISQDVSLPVAVGIFWPAVVLPHWLSETLTPEQLRPILAHELAHVRRQDAELRWVAALFQIVFYYQPCYWWLRRELRLCQEFLADADATGCARSATEYAEQLVALLKAAPTKPWQPSSAIGILERRSELYYRIQMLVASSRAVKSDPGRRWNLMAGTLLIAFSFSLGLMTLHAADEQPQEKQQSAVKPQPVVEPEKRHPGFQFQVVDTKGKPVAGAQITLWGYSNNGGSASFSDKDQLQTITKTDARGMARIFLPTGDNEAQQRHWQKLIDSGPERLALKIEHPGHPTRADYFEIASDEPIVLSDSTTIEIRAHRSNKQSSAGRLYPAIGQSIDWSEKDGLLTVRRVDLASKRGEVGLRIIDVPEAGPAWFSDLIDLKSKTGNPIAIQAELKPGVRVAGRLSDQVPRPIKNGRVVAAIAARRGASTQWFWESTAVIAADGKFEIESLPANENLEIVAICDGWVSSNPTAAEFAEYGRRYGLLRPSREGDLESTIVFPQLWRLEGALIEPSIPMQRTGSCEVTVLDELGKGIPGAVVAFAANQVIYEVGSKPVGDGWDRLTSIRAELKSGISWKPPARSDRTERYSVKTDDRGIAVISNLPAGRDLESRAPQPSLFFVWHNDYEVNANSPDPEADISGPQLLAEISPGKTGRITASMRKSSTEQGDLLNVTENEFAGRIVDQLGQPVDDVQVLVWEQDEDKIRSDKNGVFRHQMTASNGNERHLLVRFKKPGYAPHLVVDWSMGSKNRVVVLDNKTYIEGTVRRPDGAPAVDVLVRANQGPKADNPQAVIGDIWTETRTDSAGHYKLLVQPDSYAIEIRAPGVGTARVPKSDEKGGVVATSHLLLQQRPKIAIAPHEAKQLDIQLVPGVDFQAQLIDGITGQPVLNVRLWHWQYPGIEGQSDQQGVVSISTMPEGEFTFMIEAPVEYVHGWSSEISAHQKQRLMKISKDRATPLSIDLRHGIPFDLQSGMPRVTITLEPGVTMTGHVLDPNGQPVSGATVAPARSGKGTSLTGDTRFSVVTAADGSFTLVLPPSGSQKYNLVAHDGKYQQWRTWANGVGPTLETKPGQKIDNVELRLSRAGSIRGRTVDKLGQPLANIYVQATALDRLENNYYNPGVRSDSHGQFELSLIRPGKHLVHGWMQVRDTEQELKKFPTVDVEQGQRIELGDLYIPPPYRDHD